MTRAARAVLAGLLALATVTSWAQSDEASPRSLPTGVRAGDRRVDGDHRRSARIVPAERELAVIFEQDGTRPVTDLTLDEVGRILDLRSVAKQQHDFVERAVVRSFLAPGLGHATSGARRAAAVFATAAVVVDLATVAATSWLLPPAVQHRNLNYLQSSFEVIEGRWKSISPAELIPAVAATLTGGLLSLTVRLFAARDAESTALEAIETGTVRFEPVPLGGVAR